MLVLLYCHAQAIEFSVGYLNRKGVVLTIRIISYKIGVNSNLTFKKISKINV